MEWEHGELDEKSQGCTVSISSMCFILQSFPVLSLVAACWGGKFSKHDQGRVDKVIYRASRIVGRQLYSFQSLYRRKLLPSPCRILFTAQSQKQ